MEYICIYINLEECTLEQNCNIIGWIYLPDCTNKKELFAFFQDPRVHLAHRQGLVCHVKESSLWFWLNH